MNEAGASGPVGTAAGVEPALAALDRARDETLAALADLVRIPGVSAPGFPAGPLDDSARAVAELLAAWGLEHVEVLGHPGAPPYVVADWCHAPGAPTVLVYGHHDVQPPGDPARWTSPPWEPAVRDGRLYGRGAVDDKAGVLSHLAALRAWHAATGGLPLNVKVLVEGEEEVGSPHLADFLAAHRERLAADCLVLTDTCNLDTGIPSLTVSLRGLAMVDVEVAALEGPLHSGIWGGPVPDPAQALARLLARLSDDAGRPAIPGIAFPEPPAPGLADLPYDADRFRAQGGLLDGVPLLTDGGGATYHATWDAPTVTVSAIEAGSWAEVSNQILPSARARVGVRLAPEQDPDAALAALTAFLERDPPFGCRVTVTSHGASGGWRTAPAGPYFRAAATALEAGYGAAAVHIGCGGSIPFVEPFARSMGDVPALLLGVEDPACRAHGEDESLSLADFDRACKAAVHLYAEIGRLAPEP
jgi:acetylornithine deacetylase/succinyl-diaminopimelate desuccinylase-like protein